MINKELRWIIGYLNRYPMMSFITVFGSVIEIILFSSPNLIIGVIIGLFFDAAPKERILTWIIYLLMLVIIQAIVFYIVATVNEILAHRVTTDMTADLYKVLQERPLFYHDTVKIGDLMARATGDTRSVNIGLSPAIRILIQVSTQLVTSLAIFIYLNWKLALILLISFPMYALLVYHYGKKLGPESIALRTAYGNLSVNSHETFRGINEIKSYIAEKQRVDEFSETSAIHAEHVRKFGLLAGFYPPALLINITLGITAIYGMYLISIDELSLPEFVIFVGLISTIQFMSRRIRRISTMTVHMIAAASRLMEIFEIEIPELNYGNIIFNGIKNDISFEGVNFRYNEGREWALRDINLNIPQGSSIAIVGGPGSGKSTFIKLLLRLYDPQEGTITIDGISISEFEKNSLRSMMSSIEQDIFLFSDTVKGNIAFGNPEATDEQVIQAAELAHAADFITSFKDGYDTLVGERGITLSGGQKQRIAIARALLMNPSILIMDDASSALDAETEAQIQSAIKNVLHTRTSIIITHRLSIISEVDTVIVFDRNTIVANGSHKKLLRTSIEYRRLFEHMYNLPKMEVN